MATDFWHGKGTSLTKFMEPGTTIPAAVYCETLPKLIRAIQNKSHEMLPRIMKYTG